MTLLRFVHAADLHLDSPFTGLKSEAPPSVAETLYRATFDAYDSIIDLCINEGVDALLVAGDIYDSADRSLRAQRAFISGLERLDEAGIRSFICHGNHDPLDGWEARLAYPPSSHRFGPRFEPVPIFDRNPNSAIVHGISYPTREVTRNLVDDLGTVEPGSFSIGLLHANVGGNASHSAYAPCSLSDLNQSGVDYWALGHVHARQVLQESTPTVAYPGNPQGRNPTETGPKGVYLVEVNEDSTVDITFRCTDIVRWERLHVDIADMQTEQDLIDSLDEITQKTHSRAEGRSLVTRIALSGRGDLADSLRHPDFLEDLRDKINEDWQEQSPFVWCERIENETASPFNREERLAGSDFIAEFLRVCDASKTDRNLRKDLEVSLSDLFEHRIFKRYLRGEISKDEYLSTLIEEAELIAMNLLIADEEA